MNTGIAFLLELLYNRVILDGKALPIIKKSYPIDKTPCITLDEQDTRLEDKYFTYEPQEYLNREYHTNIVINIWCDTEKIRQDIIARVNTLFNWLETDNYQLCNKYFEGYCSYLKETCPVPTSDKGKCKKNQCPNPQEYWYMNLFTKYNVFRNTLNVSEGIDNDEYDKKTPILRTMIKTSFKYKNKYNNEGKISQYIINEVNV